MRRLGMLRGLKVQFESLSLILSSRSCQEAYRSMEPDRGALRYFVGKFPSAKLRMRQMLRLVIGQALKKIIWDLMLLIFVLLAVRNVFKHFLITGASCTEALPNNIMASTNF